MPPKVKTTKEAIVATAVELVRRQGAQGLNARAVAAVLGCSTQPIFSNFATMEDLREAVVAEADTLCNAFIRREVERGEYPPYKASGMAYIRFAKEEKELFKLLYMRDRTGETLPAEFIIGEPTQEILHRTTGLEGETAKLFHLEMWAYVHGVATMYATGFIDLPWELVSRMLTDAYQGLRKQYGMEG